MSDDWWKHQVDGMAAEDPEPEQARGNVKLRRYVPFPPLRGWRVVFYIATPIRWRFGFKKQFHIASLTNMYYIVIGPLWFVWAHETAW